MGYFAVLKPDDSPDGLGFEIIRCHINLWILPSLIPNRRLIYFDLGIDLKPTGEQSVGAVEVLLPFTVEEGYNWDQFRVCEDLYDRLFDDEIAELIFGEPVKFEGAAPNRTLTAEAGQHRYQPRRIDLAGVEAAKNQPPRSSCYRIPLQEAIPPGETGYIRLRFRVFGNKPIISSKSPFGGVILDFRIADVRESRTRNLEASIRKRVQPIESVNFFAMLPSQYQLSAASPNQRYMRVLETRAWSKYLNHVAYRHPSNAQLVYYWRSKKDDGVAAPITADNPFRVFANYDRHLNKALIVFWTLLAVLLLAALARSHWIPAFSAENMKWLIHHAGSFLGLLTLAGILGFVRSALKLVMNHMSKPRLWFRWFERIVLGSLPRS